MGQAFKMIFFKNKTKSNDNIRDGNSNLILDNEDKVKKWRLCILTIYINEITYHWCPKQWNNDEQPNRMQRKYKEVIAFHDCGGIQTK